jgi:hypothetical protein
MAVPSSSSGSLNGGNSNSFLLGAKSNAGSLVAAQGAAGSAMPASSSGIGNSNPAVKALMLPASPADEFKWTTKYLRSNQRLQEVVTTLLELAFLPPHRSLHAGKVQVTFAAECSHERLPSLLIGRAELLRSTYQVRGGMC